jgi:carboxylesterase
MQTNKNSKSTVGQAARPRGSNVGVLLLHGLAGTPAELRFLGNRLSASGFAVSMPTLPGLAGNTDISGLSTWPDWVNEARKAYDKLALSCDRIYVGGLSAGALLALKLAADKPQGLAGTMLFAPTLRPNGWSIPWTFKLFYLVHCRWFARLFQFEERSPFGIKDDRIRSLVLSALQNEHSSDIFRINGVKVMEMLRLSRSVVRDLPSIKQPSIIFHPRDDDQSDLDNSAELQRKMAGRVELCVLDDSYHVVTLDRQRGYVADRTCSFIERDVAETAQRVPFGEKAMV